VSKKRVLKIVVHLHQNYKNQNIQPTAYSTEEHTTTHMYTHTHRVV